MATLTVRPASSLATRAHRSAVWSRRGNDAGRPVTLPSQTTPVLSDLYTLQPPTGASSITLSLVPETLATPVDAQAESVAAGWFESTWELQQGLDIAEGLPVDVPLEAWLQVYLSA